MDLCDLNNSSNDSNYLTKNDRGSRQRCLQFKSCTSPPTACCQPLVFVVQSPQSNHDNHCVQGLLTMMATKEEIATSKSCCCWFVCVSQRLCLFQFVHFVALSVASSQLNVISLFSLSSSSYHLSLSPSPCLIAV